MTPLVSLRHEKWCTLLFSLYFWGVGPHSGSATDWSESLQTLRSADAGTASQIEAQRAWQEVATEATAEQIPIILAAMTDVSPLTENWLRAAVDTIAERELRKSGTLPTEMLENFTLDLKQAPRARRIAYEWLSKIDATTPDRLLPQMLDDQSLELRYDAIARLINEAKETDDEQVKLRTYQRALRFSRDKLQLKECAVRLKDLGQTPDMAKEMGFLTAWTAIGPFDNTDRAGFEKPYSPEQTFEHGVEFAKELPGKHGTVRWKDVEANREDLDALGFVDLNAALAQEKNVLAYALTTFVAAKDQSVDFRYESLEATKLWVNGQQIAAKNVYHSGSDFDQYIVAGQLKRGKNQIMIKVCQNEETETWTKPWEFRLRVTDKLGGAIPSAW